MAYVRINVVFNDDSNDGLDRRSIIVQVGEQDLKIVIGIDPKRNRYLVNGDIKHLVKFEKIDDSFKIEKFVETIYIDNVKVFDYRDYSYNCYIVNEKLVCKLDYKIKAEIPKLVFA